MRNRALGRRAGGRRILQGSAAALLLPQVLGSMRALFPDERELARAMSFYGIMMGMALHRQFGGGALIQWNPAGLDGGRCSC